MEVLKKLSGTWWKLLVFAAVEGTTLTQQLTDSRAFLRFVVFKNSNFQYMLRIVRNGSYVRGGKQGMGKKSF